MTARWPTSICAQQPYVYGEYGRGEEHSWKCCISHPQTHTNRLELLYRCTKAAHALITRIRKSPPTTNRPPTHSRLSEENPREHLKGAASRSNPSARTVSPPSPTPQHFSPTHQPQISNGKRRIGNHAQAPLSQSARSKHTHALLLVRIATTSLRTVTAPATRIGIDPPKIRIRFPQFPRPLTHFRPGRRRQANLCSPFAQKREQLRVHPHPPHTKCGPGRTAESVRRAQISDDRKP